MKIATALFRFSLLGAVAALGSGCVGYPVYSEPASGVYYPAESPVYYSEPTYYPYPAYQSYDPGYALWYGAGYDRGYYDNRHDHHRDHRDHRNDHDDRDRGHGHRDRDRGNGYDNVRRDLCRDRGCDNRDDRGDWNGRDQRDNDRRDRKPPVVSFRPRPQDDVVAPRSPRQPDRVINPRPQGQPGRVVDPRPQGQAGRAIEIQSQVSAKLPQMRQNPPPQVRNERRSDDSDKPAQRQPERERKNNPRQIRQ